MAERYVTAKQRLIALHYASLGDELEWKRWRFLRLASALSFTEDELGTYLRLTPTQTREYLRRDSFPPTVELHLTLMERAVFPSAKPPLFPSTQCSSTSTS